MSSFLTRSSSLFLVSLGIVAVGCSDDDPSSGGLGGPDGPRFARVEEIKSALRPIGDAECQWLFRCCTEDERAVRIGVVPSAESCGDRLLDLAMRGSIPFDLIPEGQGATPGLFRELNRLAFGFDRGRITVDKASVDACVQQITEKACTPAPAPDHCTPRPPPPKDDPCSIEKLLVGKQQVGEDCAPGSTDCAPGLRCMSVRGDDGVCVAAGKVDEFCIDDNDCDRDLVCDYRTSKCVVGGDVGAPCSYVDGARPREGTVAERCRAGLVCDTASLTCVGPSCYSGAFCSRDSQCPEGVRCVSNRCGKLLELGESCGRNEDCVSGRCTFAVDRTACVPRAPVGTPCSQDAECASGYCDFAGTFACAERLADAQPCTSDRQCLSGRCRVSAAATACAAAVAPGTDCTDDTDCAPVNDLFCVASKCTRAPLPDGASCLTGDQCTSGRCFGAKCTPKSVAGADCGPDRQPCEEGFYCDANPGERGKCVAKKRFAERCTRDVECFGSCSARLGVPRCSTVGEGQAVCTGAAP